MSSPLDDSTADRQNDQEEPEDPRLSALIEALANGESVDWQQAESSAGSAEEKEQIRALAAISEVATFHRTWLAEAGITGDLDEDDEPAEEVPTHWGELEILERVGRGSFGDVYKAREPRLDRIVALKLIRASARTPEREAETLREGRLLAKVRHPNVATVHGTAGADGRVGFWMEFLEGKNLQEILVEQKRFEPREAAEIGIALCRALAAVHAQGIVHRDVKAQNVVRENDGRIVLTDFGVGRDANLLQSEEPSLSGTPLYLAPELFEGKPPSPASDLYALGVLLFYLVTGEFPITGNSFDELRAAHQGRKRRWLKELRKDLPGTFVAAVERALDRDPEKRGDEAKVERELGRFLGERLERRKRIRKFSTVSAMLLLAAAGMFAFVERNRIAARVHLYRAEKLHEQGRLLEAVSELEEAKRLDSRLASVYLHLISYESGLGKYGNALRVAEQAASMCDDFSRRDCLEITARLSLQQMKYRDALKYFDKAVRIRRDDKILLEIVQVHRNLGQPELGLEIAKELAESDDLVSAGELALTLSALGRKSDARREVEKLWVRFPEKKDYLHWTAGTLAVAEGDSRKAEEEFRILATQPGDAGYASTGRLLLAQILMFESKFEDAKGILMGTASLDSQEGFDRNSAIGSILLAKCFARTDPKEASRELGTILGQEEIPSNLKLFRNEALVALEAQDIALARRLAKSVQILAEKYPSDLSKSFDQQLQGELAWRSGDFEGAIRLIGNARTLRDDPQNALSMARVHIELDRCDLALLDLKGVVEKRGLIVGDFYTPWMIWNEAVEFKDRCSK